MAAGAAAAVVGTGLQIYANSKAASAKARAANAAADANDQQAVDLLERYRINADALKLEGKAFIGDQIAASAELGRGDAPLALLEETNMRINRQLEIEEIESSAKASALRAGADIDRELAGDIRKSAKVQNVGSFFSAASRFGGA